MVDDRGTTAVEFAIIAPLIAMLRGRHSKPGIDAVCDRRHAFRGRGCRPLRLGATEQRSNNDRDHQLCPKPLFLGAGRSSVFTYTQAACGNKVTWSLSRSTSTSAFISSRCRPRRPAASPRILPELILPVGSCELYRVGGCHGAAATSGCVCYYPRRSGWGEEIDRAPCAASPGGRADEGLAEQYDPRIQPALAGHRVSCIARREHKLQSGRSLRPRSPVRALHPARHHHVGERRSSGLRAGPPAPSRFGLKHLIAEAPDLPRQ